LKKDWSLQEILLTSTRPRHNWNALCAQNFLHVQDQLWLDAFIYSENGPMFEF